MKKILVVLATPLFFSLVAHANADFSKLLNETAGYENKEVNVAEEQRLLAQVNQVYANYSQVHPICNYQPTPGIVSYPQQRYTLTNPYAHNASEINAINFKIRNFVLDGQSASSDPTCGLLSIKCASYVTFLNSSSYYCERVHNGTNSDPMLLEDTRYTSYLAYQTIYNQSVMPKSLKDFGLLQQFFNLDAFAPYSSTQIPNPNYAYNAVAFTTFPYPDPTTPLSPNYNNGNYGFLFLSSAENLKSVCHTIQHQNLSHEDAAVRFSEFLGIPPDSPDVVRFFTFFKLRNNPHVPGVQDGNMFRPCPLDGNIETSACSGSALAIPHNCSVSPPPYDGTTVGSFLASYFYSSYCNSTPNRDSGMPVHFPWTGQGFTYDWYPWHINLTNVQGTSEYVPATNAGGANIEVASKKSLEEFLLTCEFDAG